MEVKEDLLVIDFDHTLVPFDSFRNYLWLWWPKYPISASFLLCIRVLRLISAANFKARFMQKISGHKSFKQVNADYASYLISKIDSSILGNIQQNSFYQSSTVLLLSASPHAYILEVAALLHMKGQGSFFEKDNAFVHLHGVKKAEYIQRCYPDTKFNYRYSIGDSKSDLPLLQLFEQYTLLKREAK